MSNQKSDSLKFKVLDLCKSGSSIPEIAKRTGLSYNTVKNWLQAFEAIPKKQKPSPASPLTSKELMDLLRQNMSLSYLILDLMLHGN